MPALCRLVCTLCAYNLSGSLPVQGSCVCFYVMLLDIWSLYLRLSTIRAAKIHHFSHLTPGIAEFNVARDRETEKTAFFLG